MNNCSSNSVLVCNYDNTGLIAAYYASWWVHGGWNCFRCGASMNDGHTQQRFSSWNLAIPVYVTSCKNMKSTVCCLLRLTPCTIMMKHLPTCSFIPSIIPRKVAIVHSKLHIQWQEGLQARVQDGSPSGYSCIESGYYDNLICKY